MTMTYSEFVNYEELDGFKREAMEQAAMTRNLMEKRGYEEISWSRGESCYLFRHKKTRLIQGVVIEGLGTKNLIADDPALRAQFGRTYYDSIARCNVRMTENDMVTLGVLPFVYCLHPAVEDSKHLAGQNGSDLLRGTREALEEAGCTFGPGETPGLRNVIVPGAMCLSGAGVGVLMDEKFLMAPHQVRPGLRIVLFASSGVHANGISLTRKIAGKLPKGYLTDIGDGRLYGDVLLTPTRGYAALVEAFQEMSVKTEYAVNITGHGYAKLMRAPQRLTYVVERVPEIPLEFRFIMENGPVDLREMYGNYNMGAGFAVFMEKEYVEAAIMVAESLGIEAFDAGYVEEGERQVILRSYPEMKPFTKLDLR